MEGYKRPIAKFKIFFGLLISNIKTFIKKIKQHKYTRNVLEGHHQQETKLQWSSKTERERQEKVRAKFRIKIPKTSVVC